ncbi:MAG: hypothetical protein ACTHKL_09650 [Streptosporangiaceae bacterium]
MFSVDPGLLPIGLGGAALTSVANVQSSEARIFDWIRDQFAAGRGADPEDAARLVLALARIDQIERDDLHTLRLRRLP